SFMRKIVFSIVLLFLVISAIPLVMLQIMAPNIASSASTSVPPSFSWFGLLFSGLFSGGFILVGVAMIVGGFYIYFKEGSWFVGTSKRLVEWRKNLLRSRDWEQFNGTVEVSSNNLSLEMRTGRMQSRKNSSPQYVPDRVYISGIEDAILIEGICRKRIQENDPTPTGVSQVSS
ncbi:MAG: hypothetical protein WCP97_06380, partial [bacterium]